MVKDWGLGDMKHGGLREELLVVPPVLGRHASLLGRGRERDGHVKAGGEPLQHKDGSPPAE